MCPKAFSQTGVLKTHLTLHNDERKFLCMVCSKRFRQKSQLRLHQLRHEGVKKWSCNNCNSKFLTKGDLKRHTLVHTGERLFQCDLCSKSYTRKQSLDEHLNRHRNIKPYQCQYCQKKFTEMSSCYKVSVDCRLKIKKKSSLPGPGHSKRSFDVKAENDFLNSIGKLKRICFVNRSAWQLQKAIATECLLSFRSTSRFTRNKTKRTATCPQRLTNAASRPCSKR